MKNTGTRSEENALYQRRAGNRRSGANDLELDFKGHFDHSQRWDSMNDLARLRLAKWRPGRRWLGGAAVGIAALLVFVAVEKQRDKARRTQSRNNLKSIGLAVHNYHESYGSFPPGHTIGEDGQPYHSWLTVILPFIDANPFTVMIDFTHPWDNPRNAPISRMPIPVYLVPGVGATTDNNGFGLSHYAASSQVIDQVRPTGIADLSLGSSNTVLAGEIADGFEPWARPVGGRDPSVPLNSGASGFGRVTGDGAYLVMADGSVRFVANSTGSRPPPRGRKVGESERAFPGYTTVSQKLNSGLPVRVQLDRAGKTVTIWAPDQWRWKEDLRLTDDDVRQFTSLNALEAVFIAGPDITDDGLASLANLKTLQVLEIRHAPLTDEGIRHLMRLADLKILQLRDTSVTPEGTSELKRALPGCDISVSGSFAK
jgi:hypothetical protein